MDIFSEGKDFIRLIQELTAIREKVRDNKETQLRLESKLEKVLLKVAEIETRQRLERESLKHEILSEMRESIVRSQLEWEHNRELLKQELKADIQKSLSEEGPVLTDFHGQRTIQGDSESP